MPVRRDRPGTPRRGRAQQPVDVDRDETHAANRSANVIALGAAALVIVGGLALWLLWGGRTAPRPPTTIVDAPAPQAAAPQAAPTPMKQPTPAHAPANMSASGAPVFVRGINLGGEGVTIDGRRWLSQTLALANGLEFGAGTNVAPAPIAASHLDFDTKTMLDSGCSSATSVRLAQRLPNGAYDLTLWIAGAQGVDARVLVLSLQGADAPVGDPAAHADTWAKLGPYPVTVTQHRLEIAVAGLGSAHLAGMTLSALGVGETTVPAAVTLTSPERDAQLYSGDIPLVVDIVPANGRVAKVEYFDGATRIGETTAPPYALTWRDPSTGAHQLTAVVSDTTATRATSAPVTVTIKPSDGSPQQIIGHAKDALRRAGFEPSILTQEQDGLHLNLWNSGITDLTPIAGVPLTVLDLSDNRITDLAPLAGMPLRRLIMRNVKARDFSFLKGMPLIELRMPGSDLRDLRPLAGLKLEILQLNHCPVTDLSPLAGMPLTSLDLEAVEADDFTPLAGLPLVELNLAATKIRDLAPLAHLPLKHLTMWGCPITSLAPLRGMPLEYLHLNGTKVRDLAPLAGMKLVELSCADTPIEDLAHLAGMPLRSLNGANSGIHDLAPLTGLPLINLDAARTAVADLRPLAGAKLERLILERAPVIDLTPLAGMPLAGMPLVELDLRSCTKVGSLAPLATLAKLQMLFIPAQATDLDALRQLGALRLLDTTRERPRDAATFWRERDAQGKSGR